MSSPVADTLRDLAAALNGLGEGWYLFGAQAALLHGSRRLTADIDITFLPGEVEDGQLIERLTRSGFTLRVDDEAGFVARTRVVPVVHDATGMPVDVVIGGPGLEALFASTAEPVDFDGVQVPLPTADHIVVMKLIAARAHDLEDAAAIVRTGSVDLAAVGELVDAIAEGLGEDGIRDALAQLRNMTR